SQVGSVLSNFTPHLYRRYCDDIMLIVPQTAQAEMKGIMAAAVARAKVRLNIGKTDIVSFPIGSGQTGSGQLQYLGFTYDGRASCSALARRVDTTERCGPQCPSPNRPSANTTAFSARSSPVESRFLLGR
ncbi:MAG: hypothetical protein RLZZ282_901, partial [Verrucomicrobiota bacterium]